MKVSFALHGWNQKAVARENIQGDSHLFQMFFKFTFTKYISFW